MISLCVYSVFWLFPLTILYLPPTPVITLQPPKHSCVFLLHDLWIMIRTSSVTMDLNLIIRAKWAHLWLYN